MTTTEPAEPTAADYGWRPVTPPERPNPARMLAEVRATLAELERLEAEDAAGMAQAKGQPERGLQQPGHVRALTAGAAMGRRALPLARQLLALLDPPPAPALQLVADPNDTQDDDAGVTEGLRCPYADCGHTTWDGDDSGVRVVDAGERWNSFGYTAQPVEEWAPVPGHRNRSEPTGRLVPHRAIVGSYGSPADMHTQGYACEACGRPVTLPEDVEEDGN